MWFTQSLGYIYQTMRLVFLLSSDYNLITIYSHMQLYTSTRKYYLNIMIKLPNRKKFYTSFVLVIICWLMVKKYNFLRVFSCNLLLEALVDPEPMQGYMLTIKYLPNQSPQANIDLVLRWCRMSICK